MSATMDVAALNAACRAVASTVETRTTIPILSNVLIEAKAGGGLRLIGTNLDQWVTVPVEATVDEAFATTVEARRLSALAGALEKGAQVKLTPGPGGLKLVSGRTRANLPTLPAEDFPSPSADGEEGVAFAIDAATLRAALSRVAHAISTEEVRYYLCGVLMHASGPDLRMVATDGHRLAQVAVALPDGAAGMDDAIVAHDTIRLLLGRDDSGDLAVRMTKRRIAIDFPDGTHFTAKLIEGQYPDYERIIPTGNPGQLTVDRDSLDQAIARAVVISSDKRRVIAIDIEAAQMRLSVRTGDGGEVVEDVAARFSGDPMRIGFNAKYLREQLATMPAGDVRIHLADGQAPVLFGDGAVAGRFVLMPFRV